MTETPRVEVTEAQKGWLRRAWGWFGVAFLGMKDGEIPDAIPRYSEERGFYHVPSVEPQWHHRVVVGEAKRIDHQTDEQINDRKRLVPVSARNHVGKGMTADEADNKFIIHKDTYDANQEYSEWKKEGGENPYEKMGRLRRLFTGAGKNYHDEFADPQFEQMSEKVVNRYEQTHPEDKYPEYQVTTDENGKTKRRRKT